MEKYLFFIFVILLCYLPRNIVTRVSTSNFINDPDDNKIVGGYNATIQQFPYQAFLLISQGVQLFQCGGSIISSYYILTAAHCIQQATLITARVGSTFADRGGKEYTSLFFMNHPFYNPTTIDYDVAFVRTLRKMTIDGTNTRVIPLAPSGSAVVPGTILTVSGWGATTESGSVVNNLRAVKVPVISSADCKKAYKTLTPRMVCAGVQKGGKDSCGGDSGGPAVTDDGIQRGIVSYGIGCARPDYPGVYTNVSSVRSWIRLMTGV